MHGAAFEFAHVLAHTICVCRAALTQARINAKKRTLLGDAASATAEPVPQSFQERALLRRKREEAARLKDPSLFPSLGGKKMEPKKKTGDIWQLDSVHISEAELEAARPPKLEGEGDEGLGLKVVLQPGTRIVDDGEQLDKILKDIAGVSSPCGVVCFAHASFISSGSGFSRCPSSCRRHIHWTCARAHTCGANSLAGVLLAS